MAGDLDNLTRLLDEIAADSLRGRDYSFAGLREAIAEVLCFFPVYRSYVDSREISPADRAFITEAVGKAKSAAPQRAAEIEFTGMVLLGEGYAGAGGRRLNFVRRFQQLTGSLMAKGFEDTPLYNYTADLSQ